MKKKILVIILILLAAALVAWYIVDIVINGTDPFENLVRMLGIVLTILATLIGISFKNGRRKTLRFYELQYKDHIKDAFGNSSALRKKLLAALRYYNENNYRKSAKILGNLMYECSSRDEYEAVGSFLALVLTDMKLYNEAIQIYQKLIDMDIASSTIYSNMGYIYSDMGMFDNAISYYSLAIQYDPKNVSAYSNFANMYFRNFDFDNAKIYAQQAIAVNHKFLPSLSLLAIIYSLEEDVSNANKYFHMAVSSGRNPDDLKDAISYYKSAQLERN